MAESALPPAGARHKKLTGALLHCHCPCGCPWGRRLTYESPRMNQKLPHLGSETALDHEFITYRESTENLVYYNAVGTFGRWRK